MEMRRMVRRRLLAAFSMLVLSTDLASNGGSMSASMAPEVFCAKNSSYLSELHARESCGHPGTAQAVQCSTSNLSFMVTAKSFWPSMTDLDPLLTNGDYIGYQGEGSVCSFSMTEGIIEDWRNPYNNQTEYCKALMSKGPKDDGGSATVDENPYFRSDDHSKTYDMVFHDKTSPLVHDVCVDSILDIAEYIVEPDVFWRRTITVDLARNTTVDFIMPYTESGVYLSLKSADNDSKQLIQWIFLKPLTKELWIATACFVFFTGFVFWMIERSMNPVFQGSSSAQFNTALYFVFSTLTFSHGQILKSPLSRIVLVVWCFAVLVLVQSYVTTLSSMLAAEASANNGSSSAAGPAPLTLRSFSGLFVVTGCIYAFMLLINFTRSAYAAYTRVRGSESQSTPQNDAANGSVVLVPEQPVQEIRDNDSHSQGAHVSSAISGDEEAGGAVRDSMSNASEPAPDVYVQIEMTSTSNGFGGVL